MTPNLPGRLVVLAASLALLSACSSQRSLMPTPNLYTAPGAPELFDDALPDSLKSSDLDILFVTDRAPETVEGVFGYGYGRSQSLAFGTATVSVEPALSWDELERRSLDPERSKDLKLRTTKVVEAGRFPRTPLPVRITSEGEAVIDPAVKERVRAAEVAFQGHLLKQLADSPRKEVMVYVHGFNNSFEDAVEGLAELWHFMGREIVPIAYTWPAGKGGASGYIYDRESGEFTVFHLKQLIDLLGRTPEVEKVHLLAHSRGTDVLTSAVRELILYQRGAGEDIAETLRVENLVLLAPDLDMDVVSQRFISEYLGSEVGEVTVYTSQSDRAVGFAERFFGSRGRIGTMTLDDISDRDRQLLKEVRDIAFVELEGRTDSTGHGYFHSSPAASSDLIMTVRFGMEPGAENGRPLTPKNNLFWLIDDENYPAAAGK